MPEFNVGGLISAEIAAPIGRITASAISRIGCGMGAGAMRIFGRYAIVYVIEGCGTYHDGRGYTRNVTAGDCIFIFPDVPHTYGPEPGITWAQLYIVFEGPVFDLWRSSLLLDPARPVARIEPVDEWYRRIEETIAPPRETSPATVVARFLTLLTEIIQAGDEKTRVADRDAWFGAAQRALGTELGRPISMHQVAEAAGMPYETFRKRFAKRTGVSPARYRSELRIDTARELLTRTDLPIKQIASFLGFSNEFNFSRHFHKIAGSSPGAYRRLPDAGEE